MENTTVAILSAISGILTVILIQFGLPFFRQLSKNKANKQSLLLREIEEERKLSDEQISKIKNHYIRTRINEVLNGIETIYYNSKKGRPQKVYALLFYYVLNIYKQNLIEQIERVIKNKQAEKDHVTKLIREAIIKTDSDIRPELLERNINTDIIDKFLQWYKDNYDWYLQELNVVLNNKSGYFGQVDQTLWLSNAFLSALFAGFKQKIDIFNGDTERILSDEVYFNINWGEFFLKG